MSKEQYLPSREDLRQLWKESKSKLSYAKFKEQYLKMVEEKHQYDVEEE